MEKDTRYELLDKASISADQISRPSVSYWKDAWRRFRKDKLAMFGLVITNKKVFSYKEYNIEDE